MAPLIKLAVGVAGTALIANMAYRLVRSPLLSDLGSRSAGVMAASGITDGRVNWVSDNGWTWRVARLSGTADAATRVRTRDAVAALTGVHDAEWEDQPGTSAALPVIDVGRADISACQARIDAITADHPIEFEPRNATPDAAARQLLDAVAQTLQTCPGARIAITVHTGLGGAQAIVMALSQARAEAVARALAERGINPAALFATGKGGSEPLVAATEAGVDSRNNRVVFRITPQERPR